MAFQFDKRNGDLVDIDGEREGYDEGAVVALSEDAQRFAAPFRHCSNCGGDLPEGHGTHSRTRPVQRFCDACAGIAEALGIGARKPAFLYDDNKGNATTWTGAVMGKIVHGTHPTGAAPSRPSATACGCWTVRSGTVSVRPLTALTSACVPMKGA
jgi:hypothetical protein